MIYMIFISVSESNVIKDLKYLHKNSLAKTFPGYILVSQKTDQYLIKQKHIKSTKILQKNRYYFVIYQESERGTFTDTYVYAWPVNGVIGLRCFSIDNHGYLCVMSNKKTWLSSQYSSLSSYPKIFAACPLFLNFDYYRQNLENRDQSLDYVGKDNKIWKWLKDVK